MSLAALQQDFRAWLHVGAAPSDPHLTTRVQAGLDVYQNNFRGQIIACLEESFAVTRAWLGDHAFRAVVVEHVELSPPRSWSLDHYANGFPVTLTRAYPDDAEVVEMATLEVALAHAFVAADAVPVGASDLGEVDWDEAKLDLSPTLSIHSLTTNALAIWSAITSGITPPPPSLLPDAGAMLVWRHGETPQFRAADRAEANALRQIISGMTFGSLCAGLLETGGDEPAMVAGQWLARWISDGLIVDIKGGAR